MAKICKESVRSYGTIYVVKSLQKSIQFLFGVLLFLVPLILWPFTSELFEFNKIVLVYLLTTVIVATWLARMIVERKFIFRRTILDIPLLVFLGSQLISTLLSIDPLTSWLGYYSRFNGGLFSVICYLLLYWAFVSNIDKKGALKLIKTTLVSAVIVSIYGVLERLGIDKNVWVQDVQHRVFSTLGQPNWLASWLVALIPVSWVFILKEESHKAKFSRFILPYLISTLFFATLIFTGSRSGLLGFAVMDVAFWGLMFWKSKLKFYKHFLAINITVVIATFLFGFAWISSLIVGNKIPLLSKMIGKSQTATTSVQSGGTALETGGTESGVIRKIVWKGAIDVWKNYPVFGTGVETFAYSYYMFRPAAHNMTSEWDFIYNKAHNEYLNFMANSGTLGILVYLTAVGFAIYLMVKATSKGDDDPNSPNTFFPPAFLAGFISLLVTNYFGFSVVPTQLLFYLFPAFALIIAGAEKADDNREVSDVTGGQKILISGVSLLALLLIIQICRYWYADTLYLSGSNYNKTNRQDLALPYLTKAVKIEPKQAFYYSELSKSYTGLALAYQEAKGSTVAAQLTEAAIESSIKSTDLSPANVNLKRIEFGVFIMLAGIDQNYLLDARDVLVSAVKEAPTDAKLFYNLGLTYTRLGQNDLARETLKKTIELRPNYRDARLAYAVLLIDAKANEDARAQLQYILQNISPGDSQAKQYLESIK